MGVRFPKWGNLDPAKFPKSEIWVPQISKNCNFWDKNCKIRNLDFAKFPKICQIWPKLAKFGPRKIPKWPNLPKMGKFGHFAILAHFLVPSEIVRYRFFLDPDFWTREIWSHFGPEFGPFLALFCRKLNLRNLGNGISL